MAGVLFAAGCGGGGGGADGGFHAVATDQPGMLLSATFLPDGQAYIAGGAIGGGPGLLLRWDGKTITTVPTPGAHAFWWIHAISPAAMWLAGESGEVHSFDGTAVAKVDAGAPSNATLFGIWGASAGELWTVGGSFAPGGQKRVIQRLSAGAWAAVDSPPDVDADATYFKAWGASAADAWIVGDRGVVLHWDGAKLERDTRVSGAERFLTVHGCGAKDVWVVGGTVTGEVRHYDGTAWATLNPMDAQPLGGVACLGGDAVIGGFYVYAARIAAGGKATLLATPKEVGDLVIHGVARFGAHVLAAGGDINASGGDPYRGFVLEL